MSAERDEAIAAWFRSMPSATTDRALCQHEQFTVFAAVHRLSDTGRFVCELHVRCVQCHEAFRFLGVPPGLSFVEPSCSVDGLEANLPIEPEGAPQLFAGARYQMPPKDKRH